MYATILLDHKIPDRGALSVTEGEREKQFNIHQGAWKFLLPKGHRPVWWSQAPFYEACSGILQLLDELETAASSSEAAKAVKIGGLLPGVTKNFVLAKQSGRFEVPKSFRGVELVEAVNSETLRLIHDIKDREKLMTPGENLFR